MAVLSRMAWDFDIWSTNEYDFIDFEVGVGSFMMPQKWAERANQGQIEATWFGASKILANLTEVASMGMKVPHGDTNALEYHMKDGALAALGNTRSYAKPWLVLLATIKVHEDKMLARARSGYSAATELANELVRRDGLDYRTAHDVVQTFILESVRQGLPSSEAKIEILQAAAQEVVGKRAEYFRRASAPGAGPRAFRQGDQLPRRRSARGSRAHDRSPPEEARRSPGASPGTHREAGKGQGADARRFTKSVRNGRRRALIMSPDGGVTWKLAATTDMAPAHPDAATATFRGQEPDRGDYPNRHSSSSSATIGNQD